MANINIYGELHNDTPEGYVTPSQQIMDTELGKRQDQINRELVDEVRDMGLETAYLTCSTPGNTWKKTISAPDFALSTNVRLLIKMEHAHTSPNSPTLNINETGEYTIQYGGRGASSINSWTDNEVLDVYFDGTQYIARGVENRTGYLVCNTQASTAAKTVDCPAFNLNTYVRVLVKMTYTNTASNPTLNINGTGAKGIIYNGEAVSSSNVWEAGEVLDVYYNGTSYVCDTRGGGKFRTGQKVESTSIDNEPVVESSNLITSGGVLGKTVCGRGDNPYNIKSNSTYYIINTGNTISTLSYIDESNLTHIIKSNMSSGDSYIWVAPEPGISFYISNISGAEMTIYPEDSLSHLFIEIPEMESKITKITINKGELKLYKIIAQNTYVLENIGTAFCNVYCSTYIDSESTLIKGLGVGEKYEFIATQNSNFISIGNISGASVTITLKDSLPDKISKNNYEIEVISSEIKDLEQSIYTYTINKQISNNIPLKVGNTYIFGNSGTASGNVYYLDEDNQYILIKLLSPGEQYEYNPQVSSQYIAAGNVSGFLPYVYLKGAVQPRLTNAESDIVSSNKEITNIKQQIGKTVCGRGDNPYNITSGKTYVIKNTGTVLINVGYSVQGSSIDYEAIVRNLAIGATYEWVSPVQANYIYVSNTGGAEIEIYEKESIYGETILLQEEISSQQTIVIKVASFNLGDFTGTNITTPSEEGSLSYRKLLGKLNCNIIATQEDVLYYGGDQGMTTGEDVRTTIFPMYKNYYRRGNTHYNFKAFASDFTITGVDQISYTGDPEYDIPDAPTHGYAHPWFLRGIYNGDILLISVHFDWQRYENARQAQINQVIQYCSNYNKVIVLGDTNCDSITEWQAFTTAGFSLANMGNFGIFPTFVFNGSTSPIDNIFVKGGVIRNVETYQEEWMNDHIPICSTIVF